MQTPIETMRKQAAAYAAERDKLATLVQAMKDEIAVIERGAMPDILRVARRISALHNDLATAIGEHPECFVKPRTVVVEGLKFGLQKQKGTLSWDSDGLLLDRAARVLDDDQYAAVVSVQETRKISATALAELDAATLKRLGVSVTSDTDAPLIKTVDGAVEKLVAAVVREATKDVTEVAA
jgi:hypothetical protein